MQNVGHYRTAHQTACDRWQQDEDARTWRPVGVARLGPFIDEDWPYRGRDSHSVGLDPQEGRSPWSSFVESKMRETDRQPQATLFYPGQKTLLGPHDSILILCC